MNLMILYQLGDNGKPLTEKTKRWILFVCSECKRKEK